MPKTISGGVKLYSRAEWGAKGQYNTPLGTVYEDIWHHFYLPDVPPSASVAEEASVMRGVEAFHISKGWRRISYNFIIFRSGRIYEGCGLHQMGAHTIGHNATGKAICYAWNGDKHPVDNVTKASSRAIRHYMIDHGSISGGSKTYGHRNFAAKSCPGNKIFPDLRQTVHGPVGDMEDEMAFEITPDSPDYQIKNLQQRLNKLLEKKMLKVKVDGQEKAQITEDGDWGKWTTEAWVTVAENYPYIAARDKKTVSGHDWVEVRIRAND